MWEKIYEKMTKDEPETGKLEGMASVSNLKSFFSFWSWSYGTFGNVSRKICLIKKKKKQ